MKSITICGSRRYKEEIYGFADELEKLNMKVYRPFLYQDTKIQWDKLRKDQQSYIEMGLTYGHFIKIEKADIIFIFNKDGYLGVSSTLEIGYASALKKPIIAYMPDTAEGSRNILFENFAKTPKDLVKLLI